MTVLATWSHPYASDLDETCRRLTPHTRESLVGRRIFVSGATGLIGSYLVDLLLSANRLLQAGLTVLASGRDIAALEVRFSSWSESDGLLLSAHDFTHPATLPEADIYVLAHGNATPKTINADPVRTLFSNVAGPYYALQNLRGARVVVVSSSEVYGSAVSPPRLREQDVGSLDPTLARSSYPIGKLASENLALAHVGQFGNDVVVVRPGYIYGPTYQAGDNRVIPSFIEEAVHDSRVTVRNLTPDRRSFCYVGDCATALLAIATHGRTSEVYNIADHQSEASILEVAELVALYAEVPVIRSEESIERALGGQERLIDASKLMALGWNPKSSLADGLARTFHSRHVSGGCGA